MMDENEAWLAEYRARRMAVLRHEHGAEIPDDRLWDFETAEERNTRLEKAKRAEDDEARRREYDWERCGAGKRVVDVVGRHYDTAAVSRAVRWVDDRKRGSRDWLLVLSGHRGTGKTIAAGVWMRAIGPGCLLVARKETPTWWPIAKLVRIGGYDGVYEALCSRSGPLVIDDLGSEYLDAKGWWQQALDGLIDARYSNFLPTCITTNLVAQHFRERYGERVADRLREGGVFFECGGDSLRAVS